MGRFFCALDARECAVAHASVEKRIAKMRISPSSFATPRDAMDLARLHSLERTLALVGAGRGWAVPEAEDAALMVLAMHEHVADLCAASTALAEQALHSTVLSDVNSAMRERMTIIRVRDDILRVASRLRDSLPKED